MLGLAALVGLPAAAAQDAEPDAAPAEPTTRAIVVLDDEAGVRPSDFLDSSSMQALDDAGEVTTIRSVDGASIVVVQGTADVLDAIRSLPGVVSVTADKLLHPSLDDSVPHIGGTVAPANTALGQGWSVAVIDSGTDVSHPALAGAVVVEACFATDSFGGGACPNGSTVQIGSGAAAPAPGSFHGSHVSGIATARATGGPRGVAPSAGLVAIRASHLDPSGEELFWESDVIAALDWIESVSSTYDIASVNMSLGGGPIVGNCDASNPSWLPVLAAVKVAGVTAVVSSGNESSSTGISAPACLTDTVAVGALTSTFTAVASFSNSGSMLDLVAPGSSITSTDDAGGYVTATGTSMAAPHVAGAVAVLRSAAPCITPDQVREALGTGPAIVDSRNGLSRPELDLGTAVTFATTATGCAAVNVGTALAGDFDGDGDDDAASFSNGVWEVSLSNGSTFGSGSAWATFSSKTGWEAHVVGDFDGDGKDDIANFNTNNGTWWVSESTGSSFTTTLWADFATSSGWTKQVAADYNGDGDTDIANYFPGNGTWWVSISNGSNSFSTTLWADYSSTSGWTTQVSGDFNGDNKADVANFNTNNGTWWISTSNGSKFTTKLWADFSTASGWLAQEAADFNGDGKDDIGNYFPGNGTWWISISNGSSLSTTLWSDYSTNSGWTNQLAADYTGDGKADIANYFPGNDTWWVGPSTGSGFGVELWESGAGSQSMQVVVADVNNDSKADIAGFDFATDDWEAGVSTGSSFNFS